jgi:hypothetical protein
MNLQVLKTGLPLREGGTYNVKIRSFPTNILAGMFGFAKAEFFEVPEAVKETPKVQFG